MIYSNEQWGNKLQRMKTIRDSVTGETILEIIEKGI